MIINNVFVYQPSCRFEKGSIRIAAGHITDVSYGDTWIAPQNDEIVVDGGDSYAIPGLTDIHFHGCMGVDFCDGTKDAIETMAVYEAKQGVTSICPATMTLSEDDIAKVCLAADGFVKKQQAAIGLSNSGNAFEKYSKMAVLCGINMEGPFISSAKKGAQNEKYIHKPDAKMFRRLQAQAGGLIKLVDIAPENDGAIPFIKETAGEVRISLAHTAADFDTAKAAIDAGARHVTHLYNAMLPFTHRSPGVVGAACDDEKVTPELICDGIHIHPAAVRTTFKMFGDDRVILISDSMEATGMADGKYQLGGQDVFVKGNLATLADGTIAGSATNLMDCMRTAVKKMNISLESAVKCAAVNSAKAIGVYDRFGSIETGKAANIVLLDKELNTRAVYLYGEKI